jgi:adenylate cyclase
MPYGDGMTHDPGSGPDREKFLARFARRLASIGSNPQTPTQEQFGQANLVVASVAIGVLSIVWIGVYAAMGLYVAAAIPLLFEIVTVIGLIVLSRTRRGDLFRRTQLAMMLALPFPLQWVLGGFVNSSAVAIWAFAGALAAIFFSEGAAAWWFGAFVAGVALSAAVDPLVSANPPAIPSGVRTLFFALNISAVAIVTWAVTGYFVRARQTALRALDAEHARSEALLLNILPRSVADRLKAGETVIAEGHPAVTVLFADIVGFTELTTRTAPDRVVALLDRVFSAFDDLADRRGLEKIKTIGDAYMVVGGVPEARADHVEAVATMALEMLATVKSLDSAGIDIRIGIDTGPVVAGVIGRRKFAYDLWGDVVNTASRMESNGLPGRIQVTAAVAAALRNGFRLERRGVVDVKGKGRIETFYLLGSSGV